MKGYIPALIVIILGLTATNWGVDGKKQVKCPQTMAKQSKDCVVMALMKMDLMAFIGSCTIDCNEYEKGVKCVNGLKPSLYCSKKLQESVNAQLQKYKVPCDFKTLSAKCPNATKLPFENDGFKMAAKKTEITGKKDDCPAVTSGTATGCFQKNVKTLDFFKLKKSCSLNCKKYDKIIECLNKLKQPSKCIQLVKTKVNETLKSYNIKCGFEDFQKNCPNGKKLETASVKYKNGQSASGNSGNSTQTMDTQNATRTN